MNPQVLKTKQGRPEVRQWLLEKPTIELLIASGLGLLPLSKHYGVTQPGMRKILQRLGLLTHYQQGRREAAEVGRLLRQAEEQGS